MRRPGSRRRRASSPGPPSGRSRDRHGRGVRGLLVPTTVPIHRSRTQIFDDIVLDVVEHLEPRWSAELATIEFAVEDVPFLGGSAGADPTVTYDEDVLADGDIPLARIIRPEPEPRPGRRAAVPRNAATRVVLYRRPLEARARDSHELAHLLHDVVVEQVAHILGMTAEEVDGPGHAEP